LLKINLILPQVKNLKAHFECVESPELPFPYWIHLTDSLSGKRLIALRYVKVIALGCTIIPYTKGVVRLRKEHKK
jgi:hypothetical protein